MTELRVHDFSIALDGFATGPNQVGADAAGGVASGFFDGLGTSLAGWSCVEYAPSESVTHVRLRHGAAVFDTMGT